MEFKILGSPEVPGSGDPGAVLSPQLWYVLISFLLVPGRVVSIDSLIDHLWAARIHWRKALDIFEQLGVPEAAFVELRLRGLGASAS